MVIKRESPYVWVTWITGLLAGDAHCEWGAWFKANHTGYAKPATGVNLVVWKSAHGDMVRKRAAALRDAGYAVYAESQNKFVYKGGNGVVLSGIPDVVGIRGDDAVVVDCKTGKERGSDIFQVLVYMWMLPHTVKACAGKKMRGQVEYTDRVVDIAPDKLTDDVKSLIRGLIQRVGDAAAPPPRVPSSGECRFCGLTCADCEEYVEAEIEASSVSGAELF